MTTPSLEPRAFLDIFDSLFFLQDCANVGAADGLRNFAAENVEMIRKQWTVEGRDFDAYLAGVRAEIKAWQDEYAKSKEAA